MTELHDNIKKSKHSFKTKSRFRLSFINENRFNEVWTIKFTRTEIVIATLLLVSALSCLVATIIVLSPIRTLLPGYLKEGQRQENIVNSMRIDSLATQVNINNAYITNLEALLTNPSDTITVTVTPVQGEPMSPDSLLPASENERQFVRQFEENERFNLNVLSPIAADGISFYPPVSNATELQPESRSKFSIVLTTSPSSTVSAIYSGTVIDSYATMKGKNTIIIQHPNGFVSKYTGIATPFVQPGDKVDKGSVIGVTAPQGEGKNPDLTFELWNKGAALNPREYISF